MYPFYRIRHLLISTVLGVIPDRQKKYSGKDSLFSIVDLLNGRHIRHILLVTTEGTIRRSTLNPFLCALTSEGISCSIFTDLHADPDTASVNACAARYKEDGCEAILAIGGGSVIDCAKAAGILISHPGKQLSDLRSPLSIRNRMPLFIAVPTTAGSGSEATAGAVITDIREGRHYKYVLTSLKLIPDIIVLDPLCSITLPPFVTACSGMDALTHAIEAYTNCFAQAKIKQAAEQAVADIVKTLPAVYQNGSDPEKRMVMLEASCKAGYAITNHFVGYVHAISHAIGALYGLPHGYVNAIVLPVVLRRYGKAAEPKLKKLAKAAGLDASGEALILKIEALNRLFQIPAQLKELKEEDIPLIIKRAVAEANPGYPVPVIWKEKDFREVLETLRIKQKG